MPISCGVTREKLDRVMHLIAQRPLIDTTSFWKSIKAINNKKVPLSTSIAGNSGEANIVHVWRLRVGHVCRVVYLWCTVCCCRCHLWRTLPYEHCAYSVHTFGGKPTYIESGARSHMAVSIM